MTSFAEIKALRKKEEASLYIRICREFGLVVTWILVNLIPRVSANAVTISMLLINIGSCFLLFTAITGNDFKLLAISFVLFNFSICLDCVDGNIARLKKQQSLHGVFLDRLVHNVSYPLLFFVTGMAFFNRTDSVIWIIVSVSAGILTELSPVEMAIENLENLFAQQLLTRKTQIYTIEDHTSMLLSLGKKDKKGVDLENKFLLFVFQTYQLFPFWNQLFIAVSFDLAFPSIKYSITLIYIVLFCVKRLTLQILRVGDRIARIEEQLKLYS